MTVALSPLSEAQKVEHSDKIWNQVINEVATLGGRTLSHALHNAMTSRPLENALQEVGARGRDRDRDRDRLSPGTGTPKGKKRLPADDAARGGRERESKKSAKADREVCSDWAADGACSAHAKGKCKDRRHPEAWRGHGKPK